ncbi:MAG: tryptophan--tRNA ligase [Bdellovibrionales bacterium]|nr:tryptophan--tRNA ligase [Bdellovibrionales bacterium]
MNRKAVMLSGIKPTNFLTLGNSIGAIKSWLNLFETYDPIFMVVDLHSLTVPQDPEKLREATYRSLAVYVAAGLDPKRCLLFVQSQVPEHAQLSWIMNCMATMGELNRMTQFKDKSERAGSHIPAGLFTYPVLMAADILLYQANWVPVGADQKQHIELTRDLAIRMNNRFTPQEGPEAGATPKKPLFTIPEPYIPPVGARIMDLQEPTNKMGKSDSSENGAVYLFDSDKDIERKLKRAVTDSGTEIAFSDDKPGIQNLLTIQAALTGKKPQDLVAAYAGKQYGHLKVDTAEIVVQAIRPVRDEAERLLKDRGELDRILAEGARRASERAAPTLRRVYDALGFALPRA